MAINLSKSRIMAGLQCHRRLWQQVHAPLPPEERVTTSSAAWGSYVGERAQALFPQGRLIPAQQVGRDTAIALTVEALADPTVSAVFEATFVADGIQARVDILERSGKSWILNEVKSSTSVKDTHLDDVAVQLHVLRRANVRVKKVRVWHIDNTYERGEVLELDKVFARIDVTAEAEARLPAIPAQLADLRAMLAGKSEPAIAPSSHCHTPYSCEFWERCTSDKPDDWVLYMPGRKEKLLAAREMRDVERIADIPDDAPMTANQRIVRDAHRSGKPWISERLADALRPATGPCAYLDFETFASAIPIYPGTRPYQAIAFQWSLHWRDARGKLKHAMFLAEGGVDPRRQFAATLVEALEKTDGKIVVYSGFERRVLGELKAIADRALAGRIDAIVGRLFDLLQVVRGNIYMPEFAFSNSIKTVGPALAPEITYEGLEIADGTAASDSFARIVMGLDPDPLATRAALERYCALDTRALAAVHSALEARALRGKNAT